MMEHTHSASSQGALTGRAAAPDRVPREYEATCSAPYEAWVAYRISEPPSIRFRAMNVRQRTDVAGFRVFSCLLGIINGETHVYRWRHTRYDSYHRSDLLRDSQGMIRGHCIRDAALLEVLASVLGMAGA